MQCDVCGTALGFAINCAGDQPAVPFCHLNKTIDPSIINRQLVTFITYTNKSVIYGALFKAA